MQEKTIINALLQVRKEGGATQVHVETLLRLRGVEPPPLPRKWPDDAFRQRELKWLVLGALKDGPQTGKVIVASVLAAKPEIGYQAVYKRTYMALARFQREGRVRREGRVWGLRFDL